MIDLNLPNLFSSWPSCIFKKSKDILIKTHFYLLILFLYVSVFTTML